MPALIFAVAACSVVVAWSPAVLRAEPPIPPLPVGPQVELVDGSVVAGRIVSCDEAVVVVENLELGLVRLPREVVSGWKASITSDRDRRQRPVPLARLARDVSPAAAGAVLLDNDDVATATTIAIDGAAARIGIDGVAEPVTIPLERIRAIAFARDPGPVVGGKRPPVTLLALRDGSRLAVEPPVPPALNNANDEATTSLRLVLASPEAKRLVIECQREAVVAMADRGASVRSLEQEQIVGRGGHEAVDPPADASMPSRSLSGGPLRARGENAFGGFSMRASGSLIFALGAPADRFEGRVAIDDSEGQGGAVRVKLWAESDGKRRAIFDSGPIRGGEMPLAIAADAPGMTRLEIEVEAEGHDRKLSRVVWLDPVLITK